MLKVVRRAWVPLLIIAVVLLGFFMVDRLRGVFGKTELTRPGTGLANDPTPFNPKRVKYEIFGPGTVATINYLDLDAQPQKAVNAPLPWSLDVDDDGPGRQPEHRGAGRQRQHRLPHHRRRCRQGREARQPE